MLMYVNWESAVVAAWPIYEEAVQPLCLAYTTILIGEGQKTGNNFVNGTFHNSQYVITSYLVSRSETNSNIWADRVIISPIGL